MISLFTWNDKFHMEGEKWNLMTGAFYFAWVCTKQAHPEIVSSNPGQKRASQIFCKNTSQRIHMDVKIIQSHSLF